MYAQECKIIKRNVTARIQSPIALQHDLMNTRSWQLKFPQFWNSIANDTKTIALSFWFFTKLEISGYNRIIFQGCRLHWSSSFLMAELERSWQYWHSCIAESLWKTLLLCCRCPNVNRTRFVFASAAVRWTYLRYCIMVFNIRIQKKVRQIGKLEQFDCMNYNIANQLAVLCCSKMQFFQSPHIFSFLAVRSAVCIFI